MILPCENVAWGKIVSFRVYQLMSGYMGSGFFPGSAAPCQGRPTATTSPLLTHGINSSLTGYDKFSLTSAWVCHALWEEVGPEQIALLEIFQQICVNLFCSISTVCCGPSHAIMWQKSWLPYVGSLSSAACWTLACVLGFQYEPDKLTFRLNFFGEGRGCRIIVQLVHLALIKGEAVLEKTIKRH